MQIYWPWNIMFQPLMPSDQTAKDIIGQPFNICIILRGVALSVS